MASWKETAGEPLMGAVEAGELLRLNSKTVKRMAARGELPALRLGRLWRFRRSALDAWISERLQSNCHPCPSHAED